MRTDEAALIRKVLVHILPLLFLGGILANLDRVNVSFAALTMNADLGFTSAMFGFGVSIFFVGYLLFEVPSNLLLARFGARRWIARIMVSWGVVAVGMGFVSDARSFYAMRLLLGIAEAGFVPGVILYLSFWIPLRYRARVLSCFLVAFPVAVVVGAPLSSAILGLDGLAGLKGWQWVFIVEGVPSVVLGIVIFFRLRDKPADAPWLSREDQQWLDGALQEPAAGGAPLRDSLWRFILDPKVLVLCGIYFALGCLSFGTNFWLPQLIKGLGFDNLQSGLLTALPYLLAAVAMVLWSRHSDRTGERRLHMLLPAAIGVAGLAGAAVVDSSWPKMALLIASIVGAFAMTPIFWTLPTQLISRRGAVVGIALINTSGTLAGVVGPLLVGWLRQETGSFSAPFIVLSALGLCAVVALALMKMDRSPIHATDYAAPLTPVGRK